MKDVHLTGLSLPIIPLVFSLVFHGATYARDGQHKPRVLWTSDVQSKIAGECPKPVPPQSGWPAQPKDLYEISGGIQSPAMNIPGKVDVRAQRRHGWQLFAGVTQRSGTSQESPPIFHTWYTVEEAFDPANGEVQCAARRPRFKLELPTQLVMELNAPLLRQLKEKGFDPTSRFDSPGTLNGADEMTDPKLRDRAIAFSHVAFNSEMYDYIRSNKYYLRKTLDDLVDPRVVRKEIADPPVRGISAKFSWWPAAPDKLTPVPVWDFDPRYSGDGINPPTSWKRIVLVDPVGNLPAPVTVTFGGFQHQSPAKVGIERFYALRLSAAEATASNADFRIKKAAQAVLNRELREGDFLLMTAMHIATREFDPWVWLTYWWTDKPGVGELASDMPTVVTGVWRNYVMDVSYNINDPKTSSGAAPVAYNPWLELFQPGGLRSQCMACHARASYGKGVFAGFNPTDMRTADKNGFDASPIDAKDPAFQAGTLSLHRIWTIFTRAR